VLQHRFQLQHRKGGETLACLSADQDLSDTLAVTFYASTRLRWRAVPANSKQPPLDSTQVLGSGDYFLAGVTTLTKAHRLKGIQVEHLRYVLAAAALA
jgi:hypothetical protein